MTQQYSQRTFFNQVKTQGLQVLSYCQQKQCLKKSRKVYSFCAHLKLFRVRLECMDLHDLLEPVEADENEGVVQLGRGRLRGRNLVDEKAVQTQGLLVDQVLLANLRARGPTRCGPVIAEAGFLEKRKKKNR